MVAIKFFHRFHSPLYSPTQLIGSRARASGFFFACLPFLSETDIFYKLIFFNHLPAKICAWDGFFNVCAYHNSFRWKLILSTATTKMIIRPTKKKLTNWVDGVKWWVYSLLNFKSDGIFLYLVSRFAKLIFKNMCVISSPPIFVPVNITYIVLFFSKFVFSKHRVWHKRITKTKCCGLFSKTFPV